MISDEILSRSRLKKKLYSRFHYFDSKLLSLGLRFRLLKCYAYSVFLYYYYGSESRMLDVAVEKRLYRFSKLHAYTQAYVENFADIKNYRRKSSVNKNEERRLEIIKSHRRNKIAVFRPYHHDESSQV